MMWLLFLFPLFFSPSWHIINGLDSHAHNISSPHPFLLLSLSFSVIPLSPYVFFFFSSSFTHPHAKHPHITPTYNTYRTHRRSWIYIRYLSLFLSIEKKSYRCGWLDCCCCCFCCCFCSCSFTHPHAKHPHTIHTAHTVGVEYISVTSLCFCLSRRNPIDVDDLTVAFAVLVLVSILSLLQPMPSLTVT